MINKVSEKSSLRGRQERQSAMIIIHARETELLPSFILPLIFTGSEVFQPNGVVEDEIPVHYSKH